MTARRNPYRDAWEEARTKGRMDLREPERDRKMIVQDPPIRVHDNAKYFSNMMEHSPVYMYCPSYFPHPSHCTLPKLDNPLFSSFFAQNGSSMGNRPPNYKDVFYSYFYHRRNGVSIRTNFLHAEIWWTENQRHVGRILWSATVPREHSLTFHYRMLNMKTIDPKMLGLELWYNKDAVREGRRKDWYDLLIEKIVPKAHSLGLKAVAKADSQMESMIFDGSTLAPVHHDNILELKKKITSTFRQAIGYPSPVVRAMQDAHTGQLTPEPPLEIDDNWQSAQVATAQMVYDALPHPTAEQVAQFARELGVMFGQSNSNEITVGPGLMPQIQRIDP